MTGTFPTRMKEGVSTATVVVRSVEVGKTLCLLNTTKKGETLYVYLKHSNLSTDSMSTSIETVL